MACCHSSSGGDYEPDDYVAKNVRFIAEEQRKRLRRHIQRVKLQDFTFQAIMKVPISMARSRGDGSNDYKSDTDLIVAVHNILVVEKESISAISHTKRPLDILHYETNTCHPGYCFLKYAGTLPDSKTSFFRKYADENGFLSSAKFLKFAMTQVPEYFKFLGGNLENVQNIHGPCITPKHLVGKDQVPADIDIAFPIECESWPAIANEWLERKRLNNWPDESLVRKIMNTCCSFVPIGFSEEERQRSLEWRISFTMAEKELTWSFSVTQLVCIDCLKLLHSTYIEPRYPKLLCSYFLKTLMFWLIESTAHDFWRVDNFFVCFKTCVNKLTEDMESATCHHFFIRENNMFDKKDKTVLRHAAYFIKSMDIDTLLMRYILMKSMFFKRNVIFQNHIHITILTLSRHLVHGQLTSLVREKAAESLARFSCLYSSLLEVDRSLIKQLIFSLSSTMGSVMLSEAKRSLVRDKESKTEEALKLLVEGTHSDVLAGNLKFASALMFLGRTDQALQIINQFQVKRIQTLIHYSFYRRIFLKEPDDETYPVDDNMPLRDVMKRFVALDVIFLPAEICIAPNFVKYQLVDGLTLFISPLVYLYCLEFECHKLNSEESSMRDTYDRFCETRKLFPGGGYAHVDTDLKAYFEFSLGKSVTAFKFLKASILSESPGRAPIWILSLLLQKNLKDKSI